MYKSLHVQPNKFCLCLDSFYVSFVSVLRNCFYSVYELTWLWGGGGGGDVESMCADIVCPSSCKTEEKIYRCTYFSAKK
jgi:hypothetical protein